jgi:hypothetical protein
MGVKRRAKDGHYYEYRRTRSGRYYTVQRDSDEAEAKTTIWVVALLLGIFIAPFTYLMSIPIALLLALVATST